LVLGTYFGGQICVKICHLHLYHSSTLCTLHRNLLLHNFLLPPFDSARRQALI
jgi:hypothetical protein